MLCLVWYKTLHTLMTTYIHSFSEEQNMCIIFIVYMITVLVALSFGKVY